MDEKGTSGRTSGTTSPKAPIILDYAHPMAIKASAIEAGEVYPVSVYAARGTLHA